MTSREASQHRIAAVSRALYRAVLTLEGGLEDGMFCQLAASTLSIGSNWCEAFGRTSEQTKGRDQFIKFARGSAYEAAFQFSCIGETALEDMTHSICDELDAVLTVISVEPPSDDVKFPPRSRLTVVRPDIVAEKQADSVDAPDSDGHSG